MKIYLLTISLIFFFVSFNVFATLSSKDESVDFSTIKDILRNDVLEDQVETITKKTKKKIKKRKEEKRRLYKTPVKNKFWTFFSELWLVKNAPIVKWDFKKPDYGLDESFKLFLERFGYYEKKFKILLVNTPNITHFGLPADRDECIFILSTPFIRTLDLSKLEISLLLFEDFLRLKAGLFEKYVLTSELNKNLGINFFEKKLNKKLFMKILNRYDEKIFDKGFNFQQQYMITKQMGEILKADLKLWNSYLQMLKKIDRLVKTNLLYDRYNSIYPSPELQISWLVPPKKVL